MDKQRLLRIFGRDLLDRHENEGGYRELTGLAGQKPWECVGEILEAAACLYAQTKVPDWAETAIVARLKPDLLTHYGSDRLEAELTELQTFAEANGIPDELEPRIRQIAL
jgi:hypothetical protein